MIIVSFVLIGFMTYDKNTRNVSAREPSIYSCIMNIAMRLYRIIDAMVLAMLL
jgi:hypothetical protein